MAAISHGLGAIRAYFFQIGSHLFYFILLGFFGAVLPNFTQQKILTNNARCDIFSSPSCQRT